MPPAPASAVAALGHARPLDGLRGVAVLAVLFHNCLVPGFQGGFFGVDIFFALSGFLITTLLIEDFTRRGAISLTGFFWRRVLRLYPALVVLIAAVALSGVVRPDVERSRVWLVAVSNLLYFSNWVLADDGRAWVGGTAHTWSLAVEVHFYVLWAVTLAFVTRRWGLVLRPLLWLALGLAGLSAAWRILVWNGGADIAHAYSGTDTRLDAVFLGVAAALLRRRWLDAPGGQGAPPPLARPVVRGLEFAAVAGITWLIATTADKAPAAFLGGFGLVGGATALLILTTLLSPHSLLAVPLQTRVLVWLGQISYSLYLWHLPVKKLLSAERLARYGLSGWTGTATCVLVSVVVAAASYYGIERAFLRFRQKARA